MLKNKNVTYLDVSVKQRPSESLFSGYLVEIQESLGIKAYFFRVLIRESEERLPVFAGGISVTYYNKGPQVVEDLELILHLDSMEVNAGLDLQDEMREYFEAVAHEWELLAKGKVSQKIAA